MTDKEIINHIVRLREFTSQKRTTGNVDRMSLFFVNVIEIACSLTELGLYDEREIADKEEYWFNGSYHMNFWDPDIENYYSELASAVKKRNYFRK